MDNYYEINNLHINSDKTQLLFPHGPKEWRLSWRRQRKTLIEQLKPEDLKSENSPEKLPEKENLKEGRRDCWDFFDGEKQKKSLLKIRKPLIMVRKQFGDQSDEEILPSSSSSSSSEAQDDEPWRKIERKTKKVQKKKFLKTKRKEKTSELSNRMRNMIGVGPITTKTEDFFLKKTGSATEARKLAIKEFLEYNLDYDEVELETN